MSSTRPPSTASSGPDLTAARAVLQVVPGNEDAEVRDRAVVAAGLSSTISDARLPDNPLVFVHPAFERTTGYGREEVLGLNCRFLQGPDTDQQAVQAVRDALASREHRTLTLLDDRKDGSAYWNELALLAEATSMLAATLDVDESLERLTNLVARRQVLGVLSLCTDGLVEHRGRSLDEGLQALQSALATAPGTAKEISEHLLAELAGDLEDDVALLVLRVL